MPRIRNSRRKHEDDKRALLASLRLDRPLALPDFGNLTLRPQEDLLLWLDRSGLTLYLLARLRKTAATLSISPGLLRQLELRLDANRHRTGILLQQLASVMNALQYLGIPCAVLKGFSLTPEFCFDPSYRHQTDLDLLIDSAHVAAAADALARLGYHRVSRPSPDEFAFSTPLRRTPTPRDFIYDLPWHLAVELHPTLWEPVSGIAIESPHVDFRNTHTHKVLGVEFPALPLEQTLLLQLLHVFRHLVGGWIRPSWLYELARFVNGPLATPAVCSQLLSLLSSGAVSTQTAHACGLSLAMAAQVFGASVPPLLQTQLIDIMPQRSRQWSRLFAERFALSELCGTKLGLLVESAFAPDSATWRKHLVRRLFPVSGRPSLGAIQAESTARRWRHRLSSAANIAGRIHFHFFSGTELAWEALRWRLRTASSAAKPQEPSPGGLLSPPGI
ncbi:MAG: nucleotidyltransferase family protein [Candidatus Korobacteraceae bacterium]